MYLSVVLDLLIINLEFFKCIQFILMFFQILAKCHIKNFKKIILHLFRELFFECPNKISIMFTQRTILSITDIKTVNTIMFTLFRRNKPLHLPQILQVRAYEIGWGNISSHTSQWIEPKTFEKGRNEDSSSKA